jgi:hypothetical protein
MGFLSSFKGSSATGTTEGVDSVRGVMEMVQGATGMGNDNQVRLEIRTPRGRI